MRYSSPVSSARFPSSVVSSMGMCACQPVHEQFQSQRWETQSCLRCIGSARFPSYHADVYELKAARQHRMQSIMQQRQV